MARANGPSCKSGQTSRQTLMAGHERTSQKGAPTAWPHFLVARPPVHRIRDVPKGSPVRIGPIPHVPRVAFGPDFKRVSGFRVKCGLTCRTFSRNPDAPASGIFFTSYGWSVRVRPPECPYHTVHVQRAIALAQQILAQVHGVDAGHGRVGGQFGRDRGSGKAQPVAHACRARRQRGATRQQQRAVIVAVQGDGQPGKARSAGLGLKRGDKPEKCRKVAALGGQQGSLLSQDGAGTSGVMPVCLKRADQGQLAANAAPRSLDVFGCPGRLRLATVDEGTRVTRWRDRAHGCPGRARSVRMKRFGRGTNRHLRGRESARRLLL
ncbi:hypothetical protein D9X30_3262 [Cupriavidus sp. U2]|nr:hypothetical protein D9X30_3262 [Cupriavidus sp. U2]